MTRRAFTVRDRSQPNPQASSLRRRDVYLDSEDDDDDASCRLLLLLLLLDDVNVNVNVNIKIRRTAACTIGTVIDVSGASSLCASSCLCRY